MISKYDALTLYLSRSQLDVLNLFDSDWQAFLSASLATRLRSIRSVVGAVHADLRCSSIVTA